MLKDGRENKSMKGIDERIPDFTVKETEIQR